MLALLSKARCPSLALDRLPVAVRPPDADGYQRRDTISRHHRHNNPRKIHKDPPLNMLQLPIELLAKSNCTRTALESQLAGSEPLDLKSERRVFAFISVALCFQDFVALSSAAESIC